jgi:hypothetical protein
MTSGALNNAELGQALVPVPATAVTHPSISDPPADPPKEGLDAKDIIFMIIATFAQVTGRRT